MIKLGSSAFWVELYLLVMPVFSRKNDLAIAMPAHYGHQTASAVVLPARGRNHFSLKRQHFNPHHIILVRSRPRPLGWSAASLDRTRMI